MRLLIVTITILGVIIAYGTPYPWMFWTGLVNVITYLIVSFTIPNIIAASAMKSHRARVEDSSQQGATDEDIALMLEEEVTITESDKQSVPAWLYLVGVMNIIISVIILISSFLIKVKVD